MRVQGVTDLGNATEGSFPTGAPQGKVGPTQTVGRPHHHREEEGHGPLPWLDAVPLQQKHTRGRLRSKAGQYKFTLKIREAMQQCGSRRQMQMGSWVYYIQIIHCPCAKAMASDEHINKWYLKELIRLKDCPCRGGPTGEGGMELSVLFCQEKSSIWLFRRIPDEVKIPLPNGRATTRGQ